MHANDRLSPVPEEGFLVCPSCRSSLQFDEAGWLCKREQLRFAVTEGIPDFILPSRRPGVERFLAFYHSVRSAEGWRIEDRESFFRLPYPHGNHPFKKLWRLRATSYELLLSQLKQRSDFRTLSILDLGAGNCWMAYRLAGGNRRIVAVDVNRDLFDGLGVPTTVLEKEDPSVVRIRAEYEFLPFHDGSFDIMYFNASLHYSPDPVQTILLTLRLLNERGTMYILDSPLYRNPESGRRMIAERQDSYRTKFGIELPDDLAGGFLTYGQLEQIKQQCSVQLMEPEYGFLWNHRPVLARFLGRREPATFRLINIQHTESRP